MPHVVLLNVSTRESDAIKNKKKVSGDHYWCSICSKVVIISQFGLSALLMLHVVYRKFGCTAMQTSSGTGGVCSRGSDGCIIHSNIACSRFLLFVCMVV